MTGNDLIKNILDQGMGNEEVKIIGLTDDGITVDDTMSASIIEISMGEMDDGEKQAAIIISTQLVT